MTNDRQRIPRVQVHEPEPEQAPGDDTMTRRDVLRRGAGAGAAVLLAGGLPLNALGAPPKRKKKPVQPKPHGRFRLATDGTPTGHNFDGLGGPQGGEVNIATRELFYERLTWIDRNGKVIPWLATDWSASADAKTWKLKLRKGVTWHDGSPFTADDVVYTFKYVYDTPTTSFNPTLRAMMNNRDDVKRVDARTVQFTLSNPLALLPQVLTGLRLFVMKNGQKPPFNPPIGTGPYKFKSWVQGENVVGTRNPHYWQSGKPYFEEFELVLISDQTARYNALQSGQIDAMSQLSPSLINSVKGNKNLVLLAHGSGTFSTPAMRIDIAPFNDVRVRTAMKLLVDRKQMNNVALGGIGTIANDVPNGFEPDRATLRELPQRQYDPEKAKSLLAQANASNLTVSLSACPTIGNFSTQMATVYAQQAKQAGVTVNLDVVTSDVYNASRKGRVPFCMNFWSGRFLDEMISQAFTPGSVNNETHWDNPGFYKLWLEYRGTVNDKKRHDLAVQLQRSMWLDGGYVIPNFEDLVDAYSAKVKGVKSGVIRNFNLYNFRDAYFA
jgi:peptide/nickel transport system substrate-binding protein